MNVLWGLSIKQKDSSRLKEDLAMNELVSTIITLVYKINKNPKILIYHKCFLM